MYVLVYKQVMSKILYPLNVCVVVHKQVTSKILYSLNVCACVQTSDE